MFEKRYVKIWKDETVLGAEPSHRSVGGTGARPLNPGDSSRALGPAPLPLGFSSCK